MANLVVHFEIHATEPQRLVDFYSSLLGWKFEQFGEMGYWSIDTGDGSTRNSPQQAGFGINGGLTKRQGPAPAPGSPVMGADLVVAVDDVDGLFAKALQLGATEAVAPNDMQGVGRLAYLLDPDGNVFGLLSSMLSDGTNQMVADGLADESAPAALDSRSDGTNPLVADGLSEETNPMAADGL
ncbi:VOC family protein [Xylanimonas sp. McL0601]|uniref:VOC family protein n=1 Tax=Xylanimonas sp. McL0601 TaxID=3414739 RepID=UPI003CEE54EF